MPPAGYYAPFVRKPFAALSTPCTIVYRAATIPHDGKMTFSFAAKIAGTSKVTGSVIACNTITGLRY